MQSRLFGIRPICLLHDRLNRLPIRSLWSSCEYRYYVRLPISRMVIHTLVYYWETDFRCLQQILIESNPCQIEKESKFSCPSLSITSNESRLVEFIVADNQGNLVCFSISWERNADNDMKQLAEADPLLRILSLGYVLCHWLKCFLGLVSSFHALTVDIIDMIPSATTMAIPLHFQYFHYSWCQTQLAITFVSLSLVVIKMAIISPLLLGYSAFLQAKEI